MFDATIMFMPKKKLYYIFKKMFLDESKIKYGEKRMVHAFAYFILSVAIVQNSDSPNI